MKVKDLEKVLYCNLCCFTTVAVFDINEQEIVYEDYAHNVMKKFGESELLRIQAVDNKVVLSVE